MKEIALFPLIKKIIITFGAALNINKKGGFLKVAISVSITCITGLP